LILQDTQQWVWLNDGNPRLIPSLPSYLATEGGAISAVSVWEVAMLFEKGRLRTSLSVETKIRDMLGRYPLTVVPLDMEIALLSRTLPFDHEDPADRFIAATAHRLGVPLATSDGRFLNLGWLKTLP
jgi:PIN domain nuclease of toxin-antitoxin system